MGVYDIDFDKVVQLETPTRLRKSVRLAWLRVLVWCVKFLYNLFVVFRTDRVYRMAHNSQVCYMEAVLNDAFDSDLRRIYIEDPEYVDPVYVYLPDEELPVWLATDIELPVIDYEAPVPLYVDSEISVSSPQFIVYYPADLTIDLDRMRALINKYRLASKANYLILTFS